VKIGLLLTETIKHFDPKELKLWKGKFPGKVPEYDKHRSGRYDNQPSYHFTETRMRDLLQEEGYRTFYEDYEIFSSPKESAKSHKGYKVACELYGQDAIAKLIKAADACAKLGKERPVAPDIFASKDNRESVRFIETNSATEPMYGRQLLGLALIQEILGAKTEIIRWIPEGQNYKAKTYRVDLFEIPDQLLE
jgi:hypothetical protein